MDLLKRELAPITDEAWKQIDDEARRVLKLHLSGRRVVDFSGPHGWRFAGVNTGRVFNVENGPPGEVTHAVRDVRPLIELRTPIVLSTADLDLAARGAQDIALDPVVLAAERIARAEDSAIYHGFAAGRIAGIIDSSPHPAVSVPSILDWPRAIASARERLRLAGVDGPYAVVLGSAAYDELTTAGEDGYPLRKRIEENFSDGSFVWSPILGRDAVLLSMRGGDYELVVGQDLSIGYLTHDRGSVELYLMESFTFRLLDDRAAVFLRRG